MVVVVTETWLKVEVSQHKSATTVVRQRIRVLRIRLTYQPLWPSGLGSYSVCKRFAVQTLLWSLSSFLNLNIFLYEKTHSLLKAQRNFTVYLTNLKLTDTTKYQERKASTQHQYQPLLQKIYFLMSNILFVQNKKAFYLGNDYCYLKAVHFKEVLVLRSEAESFL